MTMTDVQRYLARQISSWSLTDALEPREAAYYGSAAVLLALSVIAWASNLSWFAIPYTAASTLLAWGLAQDLHVGQPLVPRAVFLFFVGSVAQIPVLLTLTPLMNPIMTFALGLGVYGILANPRLRWWFKLPLCLVFMNLSFVTSPLIYGVWLPGLYALLARQQPRQRDIGLLASAAALVFVGQWFSAWVGVVLASLLIVALERYPWLSVATPRWSFAAITAVTAALFFAFPILKAIRGEP